MKKVVLTIILSNIFSQNIIHDYDNVVYPNMPLLIEIKIDKFDLAVDRVNLYYRSPLQQNYFELELISFQKEYYSGNIPISSLDGDYIEYLIIAELKNGGIISFPNDNPFENPIKIKVEKDNNDQILSQNQSSGNIKSNALILSPIQNSRVNIDDVLIALSFFSVSNLDKSEVIIYFDDEDVSSDAIIEQDLLTYVPKDISPGLHTVRVNMKNIFGINFEPIEWSFELISSYAKSTESSFNKSGKLSSDFYQSSLEDNIISYSTYNADIKGGWDWLKIKSKVKISSLESELQQTKNRLSIGFSTPFLNLGLGDVNPKFNQYVLNGSRIRGLNMNIETKYFQLNYIQGELARAIQGNPKEEAMVISKVIHPSGEIIINDNGNGIWDDAEEIVDENHPGAIFDEDNILWFIDANGDGIWNDAEEFIDEEGGNLGQWDSLVSLGKIGLGRDNYTFKNEVYGANIGFGNISDMHLNINFLKSRDNIQSVFSN